MQEKNNEKIEFQHQPIFQLAQYNNVHTQESDSSLNFSQPKKNKQTNQFNIIDDDDNVEERCV
ncbi:hypothetical protein DERF_010276, partial [Dermatophagoides farinae]